MLISREVSLYSLKPKKFWFLSLCPLDTIQGFAMNTLDVSIRGPKFLCLLNNPASLHVHLLRTTNFLRLIGKGSKTA